MYTSQERKYIKSFYAELGEIIFPKNPDKVEKTAMEVLEKLFRGYQTEGSKKLIIGRACNSEVIEGLCKSGELKIGEVSELDDGYEIKTIGEDIVIAGANPRAVLHGIYALEEWILAGMNGKPDTFVVPHFRKRSDALGHYHNGGTFNFGNDTIDAKKAEYLSRLRINQFCACFDGSPFGNNLSEFVHSDVFPFQREPSFEAVHTLKYASQMLAKYGIDFIMMIWEPAMPELFAPLDQYPPEALGRVRRPWGGDENNLDTTLCVNSPLVQEHYRNITQKFIKEYPDVKGFFFYNLDGSAWICTPELCPRCAENLVDSDPSVFNPWETQSKMVTILAEAAHEVNPDFKLNFWAATNIPHEVVPRMIENAKGLDFLTTGAMGGDHDIYISMKDEPIQVVKDTFEMSEKINAPTYVYYAYNKLEAIQTGFPNPFIVADSIQTFKRWGVKYLMEVTGSTPALNQINAITMKQFQTAPDTDVNEWVAYLAEKQFGSKAAAKAVEVWKTTRDAYECWKNFKLNPLRGSQFLLRMGLFPTYNAVGWMLPALTPSVLDIYEDFFYNILTNTEPWMFEEYHRYASDDCVARFTAMRDTLKKAVALAEELEALASNEEYVEICYYNGSFEGIERHKRKEYAKVNLVPIKVAHLMCQHKTRLIKVVRLLTEIRDGDPANVPALKKEYIALLKEELATQKALRTLFSELLNERPCLALTGMCECELVRYIDFTEENMEKITAYLAENA
ncbi:MAG: hypothetical protein E7487_08455 [Ruminococcaceae bacterium]|nr:hypothetical protein [Oscillospiraceae bacterium]